MAAVNLIKQRPLLRISFYSVWFRLSIEKGSARIVSFFWNRPRAQLSILEGTHGYVVTVTKRQT
jgi:hypothetical protein